MKVRAFVDYLMEYAQMKDMRNIDKLKGFVGAISLSKYEVKANQAFYLLGGRSSIKEFCWGNPFTVTGPSRLASLCISRGTYGLAKPRPAFSDKDLETLFAKEIGAYKTKTLTLLRIAFGHKEQADEPSLQMEAAQAGAGHQISSSAIADLMDLADRLNLLEVQGNTEEFRKIKRSQNTFSSAAFPRGAFGGGRLRDLNFLDARRAKMQGSQ